jgi:hypothetical protein
MRSYVMINECEESEIKAQVRKEMIEKLVLEWNQIDNQIARRSYDEYEERYMDFHQEECKEYMYEQMSKHENFDALPVEERRELKAQYRQEYWNQVNEEDNKIYLRQEAIEEMLFDLGARMMRPYEHCNEDERYLEYMENRW